MPRRAPGRPIQRQTVIDAPAAGLAHPVRRHGPHAGLRRIVEQGPWRRRTAHQHCVEGGQCGGRVRVAQDAQQLSRYQRGEPRSRRHRIHGPGETFRRERRGRVHDGGFRSLGDRPQQHLQTRDVSGRQHQQPLAGPAGRGLPAAVIPPAAPGWPQLTRSRQRRAAACPWECRWTRRWRPPARSGHAGRPPSRPSPFRLRERLPAGRFPSRHPPGPAAVPARFRPWPLANAGSG